MFTVVIVLFCTFGSSIGFGEPCFPLQESVQAQHQAGLTDPICCTSWWSITKENNDHILFDLLTSMNFSGNINTKLNYDQFVFCSKVYSNCLIIFCLHYTLKYLSKVQFKSLNLIMKIQPLVLFIHISEL